MTQSLATIAVHIVFSTHGRYPFLKPELRKDLFSNLGAIAENNSSHIYAIGGVEDHVHILCALPRTLTIAKLVESLKRSSSKWIKSKSKDLEFFAWQNGYGAFSVSPTNIPAVREYIHNQEQHHQRSNFKSEYLAFLRGSGTKFDPKYLWD